VLVIAASGSPSIWPIIINIIISILSFIGGFYFNRQFFKVDKVKEITKTSFDDLISELDTLYHLINKYGKRRTLDLYKDILSQFKLINIKTSTCCTNSEKCLKGSDASRLKFRLGEYKKIVMDDPGFYHKSDLNTFKDKIDVIQQRHEDFVAIITQIKLKIYK